MIAPLLKWILPGAILIFACARREESPPQTMQQDTADAIPGVADSAALKTAGDSARSARLAAQQLEFEQYLKRQDSLRKVLLKKLPNKILKNSFLQEIYIRNAVSVSGDTVYGHIAFDLHGQDCIAPDCYTTDVRFKLALGDSLVFPDTMRVTEHEYGCMVKEHTFTCNFALTELKWNHVIYHCAEHRRTLVLFRRMGETTPCGWYFTDVSRDQITGRNLSRIYETYDSDDPHSVWPYTSRNLKMVEYDEFIK